MDARPERRWSGTRSRSRSPRPDRRGETYRRREHDGSSGDWERRREGSRESSKRQRVGRHDRHGERAGASSHVPGEDREGGGRHHHRHHHRHRHRHQEARQDAGAEKELPFAARQLSRRDLTAFRSLLAHYLDLQKELDICALDEAEVRGRWKSFVGKWNRAELAEGWYDPEVFQRAVRDYPDTASLPSDHRQQKPDHYPSATLNQPNPTTLDSDPDSDSYGPPPPPPAGHHPLPPPTQPTTSRAPGPTIPTEADLDDRDAALAAARSASLTTHRQARLADRRDQREKLDELVPRADAGTHARKMEKRKEVNEKMKGFREGKEEGFGEVGEGVLMGGGDELGAYKEEVRRREEKKKERVGRWEEVDRARKEEREERVRQIREREEKVVEGLRELARQRFGGGVGGGG